MYFLHDYRVLFQQIHDWSIRMNLSPLSLLMALPILSSLNQNPTVPQLDEEIERDYKPVSMNLAYGELETLRGLDRAHEFQWPVKVLSIGHTIASYQNYSGLASAYFHHGLDIRADVGSDVRLSRGGKVVNIENYQLGSPQYWEVAILDEDGFLWQYHHVDHDTIPQAIFDAYKNGTEVQAGDKIGTVVYWPIVSFGERYHHIHLNILGKNKEFFNPFEFLEELGDTSGPEIAEIGILKNGKALADNKVSGNYTLYAHAKDLVLSKVFVLPPNSIEMQIDDRAPQTVWKFDHLPGGASENQFVTKFYVPNLACGDYGCRKPIFDLGFKTAPTQVFPVATGEHTVTVKVSDDAGNSASKSFTWNVQ